MSAPFPKRDFCRVAVLFAALFAPTLAQAGDELPADILKKVKQATVALHVTLADGRVVEGSGFVGGTNFVLTNAHVLGMLSPDGRQPQKIEIVVNSGEAQEKKIIGQFQQMDPSVDVALVSVNPKDLPPALTIGLAKDLVETQTLYVVGFPLGKALGKNITISKTSVSSLRKNAAGSINHIQVNGGMHPGNSGGPVIDVKGQVVGMAVSGVRGTQIHFAIPAELVKRFLSARMVGNAFQSPYRQDGVLKLPIVLNMVDPLNQIKKVQVATWTGSGKTGQERKAVPKIGVEPLPDDSPKESYDFSYKNREASLEVVLPPPEKGKVLWYQAKVARNDGTSTTYAATNYDYRFAPVERKPAVLAFKHRPEKPSLLDLTVTTSLKLRDLDGSDKQLVVEVVSQLAERLQGPPDSKGAMNGTIDFRKVAVKVSLDKKDMPADKILENSLKSLAKLQAATRVDEQGDVTTLKVDAPVKDRLTREDLLGLGSSLMLSLQAVTVPLPGQEVRHEKPWKSTRKLQLGSPRQPQEVTADVTFTYHGTRERLGQTEAVVFISGQVRGPKGAGLSASGRMHGQAIINLKTNQVIYADTNLNLDLDLSNGQDTIQANGTLRIVMQRKDLDAK